MTDAWTEPAAEEESAAGGDDISTEIPSDSGDEISTGQEFAADEYPDEYPDESAGIPDEPEPFVEEIAAAADLPETGDARVDEVLGKLSGIEQVPTAEHVAVYDEVHRGLQDALANLDQG